MVYAIMSAYDELKQLVVSPRWNDSLSMLLPGTDEGRVDNIRQTLYEKHLHSVYTAKTHQYFDGIDIIITG